VYKRKSLAAASRESNSADTSTSQMLLRLPARGNSTDCKSQEVTVACDQLFFDAIQFATSDIETLMEATQRAELCAQAASSRLGKSSSDYIAAIDSTNDQPVSGSANADPIILFANVSRGSPLSCKRIKLMEKEYRVRVITIKLCSTAPQVVSGSLVHICADFKTAEGIRKVSDLLAKHKVPSPWALILDYVEPVTYGTG
jgi:hypothetical protein